MTAMTAMVLFGCAGDEDDKAAGHWTPGKGDGAYDLIEAGPAEAAFDVALDHRVPAYRIESYGETRVTIDVASAGDAYLVVEGPLAGDGDAVAVGGGRVIAEDDDSGRGRNAHVDVTLDKPGV